LQGFTGYRFRNAVDRYFGGIGAWYAPYIRLPGKLEVKNSYKRDLLPENNYVGHLIPQVMTNRPAADVGKAQDQKYGDPSTFGQATL
jgi:hypothetical protein